MNSTIAFLNSFTSLSNETLQELSDISNLKRVKAGNQLVKFNETPSKVYLLVSGVIRCYLNTEAGKEYNKSFYLPISFVGSLTALIEKRPSLFVFETVTECKIYEIRFSDFRELCERNIAVNTFYSKVLESVYKSYETRLVELISLDATGRYLALKKQIPELESLIPQYHIASYLGITPVQLSRIRKKIESVNIC
ncbi:Crp/Fnr family transcriptional regulator [Gaetbulibacter saemankumensis]|uniref:Crp/Fnr family transcriptional regulator n=1 Tax=Gaetbulibacter saemankumensis TaxID=311208 RepID=UPI0004075C6D|nr:Crp/Fnr family transcriptional regulator [Gaetbulibacter saemankumensis]